ncbi:MAG: 4'-phosphopantetheinyl transferase family protein [Muribaculaceae bacterium]
MPTVITTNPIEILAAMPLIDIPSCIVCSDADIAIWHVDEDENVLIDLCQSCGVDTRSVLETKLAKRRIELLAENLLLHALNGSVSPINHTPTGAPYIADSTLNISISHTRGYVAMAISRRGIGIDIEHFSEKVLRVRQRFLSQAEARHIAADNIALNTAAWTAKEAIYKAALTPGINLSHHIPIDAQAIAANGKWASTVCGKQFDVSTYIATDYAISLAIENAHE